MKNARDDVSIAIQENNSRDINVEALEKTMTTKLHRDPPWDATAACIFEVPHALRRHNSETYQPSLISIGPLHYRGGQQFQQMESMKQWYLYNLLFRLNISLNTLIDRAILFEQTARDFYAASLDDVNSNEFIEMLIVDGCFIIELFRKRIYRTDVQKNDPIFNMSCMFQYVCRDFLLLENQLPWFVLTDLYSFTIGDDRKDITLKQLMLTAFASLPPLTHNCESYLKYLSHHGGTDDDGDSILHILDLIRTSIVFYHESVFKGSPQNTRLMYSASALSEAGVKFRGVVADSIMNIEFKEGVLTIPHLEIGELTEPLFRNLIAFEQCYHGRADEITSYAVFMDNLIGSSKDMEFLCATRIVGNWLSPEDGSQVFSKLHKDTLIKKFYYSRLCIDLNKHYEAKWNPWTEIWKRVYSSVPWAVVSLIGGFILVVLIPVVQTWYSVLQYYAPPQ